MSTVTPTTTTALVPFEQLNTMAAAFAKSGMFGAKNHEQALSLLLLAQAEGVHPAIAMRDFDIIGGRPAKKSEAMHRAFLAAGGKVEWHRLDDDRADATFSHPQGGSVRISWDMERVKKAGLRGKDMYSKYPRQMLKARCISEGCRTVYPAATSGLYVPDEVIAFEKKPERDMGPADVVTSPPAGDADEDITLQIPGQETPVAPAQELTPPTSPTPAAGAPITVDQATMLRDMFAECDLQAEKTFLKVAKIDKVEALPSADFDEAVDWASRRRERAHKK